ncbi:aromatic-L-amino-acid decarboxylase-like [Corticium candelabrum]|uniref:aromatic-L-amino-acid decarboxylase-like n=1 Tax=Corticium candelabrum TaxID=121492 RepID=UPI002E25FE69|nr:aromatic-L-amino-acid decarboxylase-like [Corticium candelabrum]
MDVDEFRRRGKEMVDIVADYYSTIRERRVLSDVQPGYLRPLLPSEAPNEPEKWEDVVKDIERVIMPGITHWLHPQFVAYYPSGFSFPSFLADMLCNGMPNIGFSWIASPAITELETVVLDWLGKALKLPSEFLAEAENGKSPQGGGVIQGTASEATLVAMLAARHEAVKKLQSEIPELKDHEAQGKLIAYGSDQAHSSYDKAAIIAGVKFRRLPSDKDFSLRGAALEIAIREDVEAGLHPFYLLTTLGTTSSCAFDNLLELGPICQKFGLWMHIDAAYAGNAFICPEYRPLLNGVEYAESFNFNPHKWMLTSFDCSCMWLKRRAAVISAFTVDPAYLRYAESDSGAVLDYRHLQIPLGRRFRSLKLWFVLRLYGISGIQKYIRKHIELAKKFETLIRSSDLFEFPVKPMLSLVCFRLKGSNDLNKKYLQALNDSGKIYMIGTELGDQYVLRMSIVSVQTTEFDVDVIWDIVKSIAKNTIGK